MASRIAAKADAGEILIPEPLRHLLTGKSCVHADRGEFVPKGFDDGMRLWDVRWTEVIDHATADRSIASIGCLAVTFV